jgi:hypothetical protein
VFSAQKLIALVKFVWRDSQALRFEYPSWLPELAKLTMQPPCDMTPRSRNRPFPAYLRLVFRSEHLAKLVYEYAFL